MGDSDLLERFVASFEKLDEMSAFPAIDPIAAELQAGPPDEYGRILWRPVRTATEARMLDPLYEKLPARFPPLYEQFVLTYRWAQVDLGTFRLLANPPATDLSPLLAQITGDKGLWDSLVPAGYIQFGRGPDIDYDPVCFEIKSRTKRKDYRIVKIDHEQILCNYRVKIIAELAPSFEELMLQTIERATSSGK